MFVDYGSGYLDCRGKRVKCSCADTSCNGYIATSAAESKAAREIYPLHEEEVAKLQKELQDLVLDQNFHDEASAEIDLLNEENSSLESRTQGGKEGARSISCHQTATR